MSWSQTIPNVRHYKCTKNHLHLFLIIRKEISRLLGANRRLSNDMIADVSEQSADDLIDGVSSSK